MKIQQLIDIVTLTEAEAENIEIYNKIKDTPEFKKASKVMKFVSTARQIKNGTLVFNTGIHGISGIGKENPNEVYLLKIYADGQIRAEMKGSVRSHYKLGKPLVLRVGDTQLDLYKAMLDSVIKHFEKKSARYEKDKELQADRYKKQQEQLQGQRTSVIGFHKRIRKFKSW